ncbi:putative reverse transcriptase domain-containing protein [Tanacetum coccineum]
MRKVLNERGTGSLSGSIKMNLRDHVKSISTTVEADTTSIRCIDPMRYAMDILEELINGKDSASNLKRLLKENPKIGYQIEASMNVHDSAILEDSPPLKEKDPRSFTIPCYINNICFKEALADLGASVSVMPYLTFTNLGLGELAPTKLIIDLDDRAIKRPKGIASLGPIYGDYIELNDINEPLNLRRNQVEDLGPTIKDGEVINEPMEDIVKTRNDNNEMTNGIDEYPSFATMIRRFISIVLITAVFMYDRGKNVVGAFINVPIFVGNFFVVTNFTVMENMDAYRDEGMGDVIVGKPFCREICIKVRRFDGMITIYNGNDSVSAQDMLNGISHPYQKLKCFYKGDLNLGPEYIRDAKIEEFLTRGHVSIHEKE